MGNSISQEEVDERNNLKSEIFELINKYPTLDTGNRNGLTDYIDYIELSEVTDMVVKGSDLFNRPFFVIKYKIEGFDAVCIQTFFKRYSNTEYPWMGCGHFTANLIDTSGGISTVQFRFMRDLIKNKEAIITNDVRPCSYELYEGKKVTLVK